MPWLMPGHFAVSPSHSRRSSLFAAVEFHRLRGGGFRTESSGALFAQELGVFGPFGIAMLRQMRMDRAGPKDWAFHLGDRLGHERLLLLRLIIVGLAYFMVFPSGEVAKFL